MSVDTQERKDIYHKVFPQSAIHSRKISMLRSLKFETFLGGGVGQEKIDHRYALEQ